MVAPGSRTCRETSARCPGSGGVSSSIAVAAAAAGAARGGAADGDVLALVEAQQLRERQLQAGGDLGGDGQGRAGLAALDLREHRRADAGALGQVAQREPHRVAQGADAGADGGRRWVARWSPSAVADFVRGATAAYVITDVCILMGDRATLDGEQGPEVGGDRPGSSSSWRPGDPGHSVAGDAEAPVAARSLAEGSGSRGPPSRRARRSPGVGPEAVDLDALPAHLEPGVEVWPRQAVTIEEGEEALLERAADAAAGVFLRAFERLERSRTPGGADSGRGGRSESGSWSRRYSVCRSALSTASAPRRPRGRRSCAARWSPGSLRSPSPRRREERRMAADRAPRARLARRGDIDRAAPMAPDPPERRGGAMAEDRVGPQASTAAIHRPSWEAPCARRRRRPDEMR